MIVLTNLMDRKGENIMLWSVLTTKNGWKLLPFFICLLGFAVSFAFGIIGLVCSIVK